MNCTIPAVVKSSVGSFGTSGDEGTIVCPSATKKSRNDRRSSAAERDVSGVDEAVMRAEDSGFVGGGNRDPARALAGIASNPYLVRTPIRYVSRSHEGVVAVNPFALLGLGLVLGMRHATDADHVVTVAAITARSRRVLGAARLGMVWGLGHTLTIFVVGAAIILFNIAVPPRVGLSFEFAVALALIVVGLLNFNRPHRHDAGLAPGAARGAERIPRCAPLSWG